MIFIKLEIFEVVDILDIILWMAIIACFILSFVGLVYPVIPSVLLIWLGVGIYHFAINPNELSWISFVMLLLLTVLLFLADYLANLHFVEKAGGSVLGKRVATLGLIIGSFVIPPFGVVIVPFALVFIVELLQKKPLAASIKVAAAVLIAFLSGTLAKAVVQLIMIIVFLLDVIF
jgi:uncharacterized protein YqgC (DUF456 family)